MNKKELQRLTRSGKPLIKLHVLGAAGGVTGSMNMIEYVDKAKTTRFLLDVGLTVENEGADFQNRLPQGVKPSDIDFVILSHAHLDHSGYLPKLVKDGFSGPAYVTEATKDLLEFMLPDSGYLQEEAARRANARHAKARKAAKTAGEQASTEKPKAPRKKGSALTAPRPERKPLYTREDAVRAQDFLKVIDYDTRVELVPGVAMTFTDAGHILGSAVVNLEIGTGSEKRRFCFTGNIGRPDVRMLRKAVPLLASDYLMTEATYGNKQHNRRDRLTVLAEKINAAYERAKKKNGVILVPAFAVGRAQEFLNDIRQLSTEGRIPKMPVFVDGPMANRSTQVHRKHSHLFNDATQKLIAAGIDPFSTARYKECMSREESEALDAKQSEPVIIVGSSGMASGGRIVRHLERRLPFAENTVLFVGYQGTGTLGQALVGCHIDPRNGCATEVKMYGKVVPVRATIDFMGDYSGHADYEDLVQLMKKLPRKPKTTFVVHGSPDALDAMKGHLEKRLEFNAVVPKPREVFILN